MYIENSAINTIDKKSIRLNRLMLNKNIILEQNDYRKILIILDFYFNLWSTSNLSFSINSDRGITVVLPSLRSRIAT